MLTAQNLIRCDILPLRHVSFIRASHPSILPDRCILHIRISGSDDANQSAYFRVLLHFHDSALCRLEDGRLIDVRHTDPHDGLVPEGAQVHEAGVNVLIHRLHHDVVRSLALEVQLLEDKTRPHCSLLTLMARGCNYNNTNEWVCKCCSFCAAKNKHQLKGEQ